MARINNPGSVRRVNKTPPRKTVPITRVFHNPGGDVQSGGGYRPAPTPKPRRVPTHPDVFNALPTVSPQRKMVQQARARTNKAQRAAEKNIVLPHLPAHIAPSMRQYASILVAQSAHRQGIHSAQEFSNLPPAQRQIVRDVSHNFAVRQNHVYARIGAMALSPAQRSKATHAQLVDLGRRVSATRNPKAHAGRPPTKLQLAGFLPPINLSSIAHTLMSATSLDTGDIGPRQFVKNALGDVKTLGESPVLGAYQLGTGTYKLVRHGDPSTFVNLGKGIAQQVTSEVRHPGRYLLQHPLLAGLDLTGAASLAGHTAGAIGRIGKVERSSRVRPPVAFVDNPAVGKSGLYRQRSYSGDQIRAEVQRAKDARRQPVLDAQGKPVTVVDRGKRVPVLKPGALEGDRLQRSRANFVSARATDVERMVRSQASKDRTVKLRGKDARRLAAMTTEGQITTGKWLEKDLLMQRARLEREYQVRMREGGFRHSGEVKQNRENVAFIDRALASPKILARAEQIASEGARHGAALTAVDKQLAQHGLLPEAAGDAARLKHPAIYHLDARWDDKAQRLVAGPRTHEVLPGYSEGEVIPYPEVEHFLRSRGRDPSSVAYLPAKSPGPRAFHAQMRPGTRPNLLKQQRTGEMARKGANRVTAKLLREQGVRQQVLLSKAQQLDKFIGEHGLAHPVLAKAQRGESLTASERKIVANGGDFTGPEAQEFIDRLHEDKGEDWTAVTAYPGKLGSETKRMLREQHGQAPMEGLAHNLLNDRIVPSEDLGKHLVRNVRLVPKALMDQQIAHLAPAGPLIKAFQLLNKPFRMSVLPQPRWLTGNFIEPYMVRLPAAGSGVVNIPGMALDIAAARKGLKSLENGNAAERQAAKEVRANQFGGLLIGGRGAGVHRTRDDFKTYGQIVKKVPAVEQVADLGGMALKALTLPAEQYFKFNRTAIEGPTQHLAFGRQLRRDIHDMQESFSATVKLGQQAVADAAKGLVNTPAQERFMRSQQDLLGKYQGYGPMMRQIMQGPAPFIPWSLSAARFVYWTMPAHRTALTALLVKTQNVVQGEWDKQHSDLSPTQGSLRAAARTKDGGLIDFSRYTPYGFSVPISEGDFSQLGSQVMPQLSGTVAALAGRNPFGQALQGKRTPSNPTGKVNPLAAAGYQFLESVVPYLSTVRRLREGGGTSLGDSTILHPDTKPGSSHGMSAVDRTFNPFRPTYVRGSSGSTIPAGDGPTGHVSPRQHLMDTRARKAAAAAGGLTRSQQSLMDRRAKLAGG